MTWKVCVQSHRAWGPSLSFSWANLWGIPGMIVTVTGSSNSWRPTSRQCPSEFVPAWPNSSWWSLDVMDQACDCSTWRATCPFNVRLSSIMAGITETPVNDISMEMASNWPETVVPWPFNVYINFLARFVIWLAPVSLAARQVIIGWAAHPRHHRHSEAGTDCRSVRNK